MARLISMLLRVLAFVACAAALKFDLAPIKAHDSKKERCIRNFVAKDTLVVVTAIVDGQKGDGMTVNMQVSAPFGSPCNWLGVLMALDPGRCRKRIRPPARRRGRAAHSLYIARRRIL